MKVPNITSMETVSGIYVDVANPKKEDVRLTDIAWSLSRQPRFAGHTITRLPYNVAHHSVFVSEIVQALCTWVDEEGYVDRREYFADRAKNSTRVVPPPFFDVFQDSSWNSIARVSDAWQSFRMELANFLRDREVPLYDLRLTDPMAAISLFALFHDAHEYVLVDVPSPIKAIDSIRVVYKELEKKMDAAIFDAIFEISDLPETIQGAMKVIIKEADMIARALEAYTYMPSRGANWNELPSVDILAIHTFNEPMSAVDAYNAFIERYEKIS